MTQTIFGDTIVDAFRHNVQSIPLRPALRRRVGDFWETLTWADFGDAVAEIGAGLVELGIEPGDSAAILGGNRVEWHVADLAVLAIGGVTVPLYPTSSGEQVAYIAGHSKARVCFVDTDEQLSKVVGVRALLPRLERAVVFQSAITRFDDPFILDLAELRAIGAARLLREPGVVDERTAAISPQQLASLVYTSGTTGPPKGAMVTHANVMWTIRSVVSLIGAHVGERFLSFLPLSHVAERMMSDFGAIALGGDTWFAQSLATVAEDLRECRPTVFFAVPRVWEKFQEAIVNEAARAPRPKRFLIDWYMRLGGRMVAAGAAHRSTDPWAKVMYALLDRIVGIRLREALGLDQAHIMITAAAPIHPDRIRWFHAIGLPVVELYGQTETCGPTTCNTLEDNRIGTVGRPIPGVSLRIASDGEIVVKGGNVCAGYFSDSRSTAALLDNAGWMHSGDVGAVDDDGFLRITGRKKDLIITAAGQNIAPQDIELDLRNHELVSEAVVVGEGRRYLTALLTLDGDALMAWAHAHGKVAGYEALVGDPDLHTEVERIIGEVNAKRSRVEQIRKFHLLVHEWTMAAGELTPTGKVRRNVVGDRYRDPIEAMYADGG